MKLVVISSAPIVKKEGQNFLYAPYEKEMQLWAKHADTIQFCCPIWQEDRKLLIAPISFQTEPTIELKEFDITSLTNTLRAFPVVFVAMIKIFKAMKGADHIHLRCPGNMALLASFVQILFPNKKKTAKYAGNWDPNSQQPWSYRLQKWILSNTFLTRNMQVLVYGEWKNQTKNIKPFFTATYSEEEIEESGRRENGRWELEVENDSQMSLRAESRTSETEIKFLFIGTLSYGKQPLYAIQLIAEMFKKGKKVTLYLYGEGVLRNEIEDYIQTHNLEEIIILKGNQSKEVVLKAYQTSHFLILPSKSEGWPKVVAEAMFWGCVPLVTPVSCVPYMLGNGNRGIILKENLLFDLEQLENISQNPLAYKEMAEEGKAWSRQFTTETFESEIKKLLKNQF